MTKYLISLVAIVALMAASIPTSSVAPGTVFSFASTSCPPGSIASDGSSLLRAGKYANLYTAIGTTFGAADGTHFTIPNLSGVFVRGSGSQTISGNTYTTTFADSVADELKAHVHTTVYDRALNSVVAQSGTGLTLQGNGVSPGGTGSTGGTETRPANVVLKYCIKY